MVKKQFLLLAAAVGFILGIRNGYIALWEDGRAEPVRVFPYQAEALPSADRMRLEEGIRIDTADQLITLIEDYFS